MIGPRRLILLNNPDNAVEQPNEAFSWLPFSIYPNGDGTFNVGDFDLQTYAGISVSKTYYVDPDNGNNNNGGESWEDALQSRNTALGKEDVDRIYLAKGYYNRLRSWVVSPARSVEVIGSTDYGTGDAVYMTTDYHPQLSSWVAEDNHYQHSSATVAVYAVWDESNLDAQGEPQPLTLMESEAEVDNTPNSWYYVGGATDELYIRTFDDREPDDDILILTIQAACTVTADNITVYVENIKFWSNNHTIQSDSEGSLKFYAKNCEFRYSDPAVNLLGVDEHIFQDCVFTRASDSDGISCSERNSIDPKGVEIDCEGYDCGTDTNHQPTTSHDEAVIVRINGNYHDCPGQCVADAGAGYFWLLGCTLDTSSIADVGYYGGGYSWLDSCTIANVATDLGEGGDGAIYYRNLTNGGNFNGTCLPY